MAVSLQCLHFREFLAQQEDDVEIEALLNIMIDDNETGVVFESDEMNYLLQRYADFMKGTESGKHGKTAQFWIQYINLVGVYHTLVKSVRTGELDLFISTLPQISNVFFALNHPNYARWSVFYHERLLDLQETHPQVYDDFKKGWFGVKRTSKSFSRSPVDLTLEQTINALE